MSSWVELGKWSQYTNRDGSDIKRDCNITVLSPVYRVTWPLVPFGIDVMKPWKSSHKQNQNIFLSWMDFFHAVLSHESGILPR